jgi:hypothetical protein
LSLDQFDAMMRGVATFAAAAGRRLAGATRSTAVPSRPIAARAATRRHQVAS